MELAKLGGRRKKLQGEGGAGRPTKHRDGKYLLSVCVCARVRTEHCAEHFILVPVFGGRYQFGVVEGEHG